jgi:catechol 2,3-dioxygenase-like lactoylglutathione lyase family enzyme
LLTGLSHFTLSVRSLATSLSFYQDLLGLRLHARWNRGAYLSAGEFWLCLSLDTQTVSTPATGYTHYAFTIAQADFPALVERLRQNATPEWQPNSSEGDSIYFLDPDGHQLEAHAGHLASRLAACRKQPYDGMEFFD